MKYFLTGNHTEHTVELNGSPGNTKLLKNDSAQTVALQPLGKKNQFSLFVGRRSYQLHIQKYSDTYVVALNGKKYRFVLEDEKTRFLKSLIRTDENRTRKLEVKAPMPGMIVKINVAEGQKVNKGDALCIIEAMKMENEIRASASGVIKNILKQEKDSVEKDSVLMTLA